MEKQIMPGDGDKIKQQPLELLQLMITRQSLLQSLLSKCDNEDQKRGLTYTFEQLMNMHEAKNTGISYVDLQIIEGLKDLARGSAWEHLAKDFDTRDATLFRAFSISAGMSPLDMFGILRGDRRNVVTIFRAIEFAKGDEDAISNGLEPVHVYLASRSIDTDSPYAPESRERLLTGARQIKDEASEKKVETPERPEALYYVSRVNPMNSVVEALGKEEVLDKIGPRDIDNITKRINQDIGIITREQEGPRQQEIRTRYGRYLEG